MSQLLQYERLKKFYSDPWVVSIVINKIAQGKTLIL